LGDRGWRPEQSDLQPQTLSEAILKPETAKGFASDPEPPNLLTRL
jgi:hypothetical protein